MAYSKLSRASDCSIFKRLLLRNGVQLVLTHQLPGGSSCLCLWLELVQLAGALFSIQGLPDSPQYPPVCR